MNCPHCGFLINPKNPRAGRFTLKCPKCAGEFVLTIPRDPAQKWEVVKTDSPEGLPRAEGVDYFAGTEVGTLPPKSTKKPAPTTIEKRDATVAVDMRGSLIASADGEQTIPAILGGYEIHKELGRGGMGSVYLARQLSLDRDVALKIMNAKWASDPIFLARFTREAYAAAQLVHHNVVQIYDIGEEKGINFFSMEFVDGHSLGDRVKKHGKMEPREAVSLILQSARGLKFAHDRGMIHRDVKPDNLILNTEGILKVADLGLVKTPRTNSEADSAPSDPGSPSKSKSKLESASVEVTHPFAAMGSPAYMSPEQCRDAAKVDRRADIYSLGCTLYVLLTGRPPFQGETALEVMSKHAMEPPIPPHQIVKEVPPEISDILLKMLAKKVSDRYQKMQEVIDDLEDYLGGGGNREFSPDEKQLGFLEEQIKQFHEAPAARLRRKVIAGFFLGGILLAVFLLITGHLTYSFVLLAAVAQTALAYFIIQGLHQKTYLFRKAREWLFGSRLTDWLTMIVGAGLLSLALILTGFFWVWTASVILSTLWAFAFFASFDKKLADQRRPILDEAQKLFKKWRIHGMEEEKLRSFVGKFGGDHWEEFFETVFGYTAMRKARQQIASGEGLRTRKKYGAWRDSIINRIEAVQQARKEAKEKRFLLSIEAKRLEAEGIDRKEAKAIARTRAERMVEQAAEFKFVAAAPLKNRKPERMPERTEEEEKKEEVGPKKAVKPLGMIIEERLQFLIGGKVRFLCGALLIAGGAFWVNQNLNAFKDKIKLQIPADQAAAMSSLRTLLEATNDAKPLQLPGLPEQIGQFFNYFNPLLAGLMLIASLFFRGKTMSICFLAGAAIVFAGHKMGLPEVPGVKPEAVAMVAGLCVGVLGFVAARHKRDYA